jgi:hypothetical protein
MNKLTVEQAVILSVRDSDPELAGRLAVHLMIKRKLNCDQVFEVFTTLTGISRQGFKSLMDEAECPG